MSFWRTPSRCAVICTLFVLSSCSSYKESSTHYLNLDARPPDTSITSDTGVGLRYPKGTERRRQLLDTLRSLAASFTFALAWDENEEMILGISVDPASGQNGFFRAMPVLASVEVIDMRDSDAYVSTFSYIAQKCPNLKQIDLRGAYYLNDDALSHLARLRHLEKVIVGYPNDVALQATMAGMIPKWKSILGDRIYVDNAALPGLLNKSRWKDDASTTLPIE